MKNSAKKPPSLTAEEKKDKARWARIKRVYGLTKEQYDELNTGSCPLCLRVWSDSVRPCIDHDHKSGYVRGLLCIHCNRYILGRLRDSSLARRIVAYLEGQPMTSKVPPKKKRKKKRVSRTK